MWGSEDEADVDEHLVELGGVKADGRKALQIDGAQSRQQVLPVVSAEA